MMRLAGTTRRLWRTEAEGSAMGAGGTGAASWPLWADGAGAWPPLQELQPLPQVSQQPLPQPLSQQLWQLFLHLNRSNRQKLFLQQLLQLLQQLLQLSQHEGAQPQAGSHPQAGSQQADSQPQDGSQQLDSHPHEGSQQLSQQLLQLLLQQPPNRPAKISGVLQQYCWQGVQQLDWQQLDSHPQEGSQQLDSQPQDGSQPQAGSQQLEQP
jgi:hypothetical protein